MRTNIVLDETLVQEAFKLSGVKTKKELINLALEEFVKNRTIKNLREIRGKIIFSEGYDYKSMRQDLDNGSG